jgi:hypothetical protein
MSIKPEDILPDDSSFVVRQGMTIRKGSAAAVLANASILMDIQAIEGEKTAALETIRELMPGLVAAGMAQHVTWKNPLIQKIMEEAEKKLESKSGKEDSARNRTRR